MATITKKVRRKLRKQGIPIPPKKQNPNVRRVSPLTGEKIDNKLTPKQILGLE